MPGDADMKAIREVVDRKAAAFWVDNTPRTTLHAFKHDVLTSGSPVRGHPVRLKGNDSRFVNEWVQKQVEEGLCKRTKSSWVCWVFPTKASETRDPRIVLDYRRVNLHLVRSVYYIRQCEDLKTERREQFSIRL